MPISGIQHTFATTERHAARKSLQNRGFSLQAVSCCSTCSKLQRHSYTPRSSQHVTTATKNHITRADSHEVAERWTCNETNLMELEDVVNGVGA